MCGHTCSFAVTSLLRVKIALVFLSRFVVAFLTAVFQTAKVTFKVTQGIAIGTI